jgi:Protein of unknown function (DUF2934)
VTSMISMIRNANKTDAGKIHSQNQPKNPPPARLPSLNEIQVRAYRVHQRHGAVGGGYTLEDWLEAEHELEKECGLSRQTEERRP